MHARDVTSKRPDFNKSYNYYSSNQPDLVECISDADEPHRRATSLSISKCSIPLKMRVAEWIRQAGSEIKTCFARFQLRSVADDFIRKANTERKSRSSDFIPCSMRILDAEIGKLDGNSEEKSFDLFERIFSEKLKSCSDEKLQNVLDTLTACLAQDTRLPNISKNLDDLLNVAVKVAAERFTKVIFVNLINSLPVPANNVTGAAEKINVGFRYNFALSAGAKFKELFNAASDLDKQRVRGSIQKSIHTYGASAANELTQNKRKNLVESIEVLDTELEKIDLDIVKISKSIAESRSKWHEDLAIGINKEEVEKKIGINKEEVAVLEEKKLRLMTKRRFEKSEMDKIVANEEVLSTLKRRFESCAKNAK